MAYRFCFYCVIVICLNCHLPTKVGILCMIAGLKLILQ